MLIGVIADNFTGASDITNTLLKDNADQGGLRTYQYDGVHENNLDAAVEAGVISLKTLSIDPRLAVRLSFAALNWLREQGCTQIVFKYCLAFDSTNAGNIGPVVEALAAELCVKGVMVCPAFPGAGRSAHQEHLFVHDTLLSESGMQSHPLTPITDPDIRRWLAHQCRGPVGLVPANIIRDGTAAITAALDRAAAEGQTLVVVDTAIDANLIEISTALAQAALVTGGSGIAMGLSTDFINRGLAKGSAPDRTDSSGPEAILLAGSCSATTLIQIEIHRRDHLCLIATGDDVMAGRITADDVCDFVLDYTGCAPLVYSSGNPADVAAAQARHSRAALTSGIEDFFAQAAVLPTEKGITHLVIAGGETSGAVTKARNLGGLRIGTEISPGVPVLFSDRRQIALALESSNFGDPNFFARAVAALAVEPVLEGQDV